MTALKIKKLHPQAKLPVFSTTWAAGADLFATEEAVIRSGEWKAVPTGLAFEIPNGYEVQIRSRSGLAAKFGVAVLNAPGTIDSDYRGEVKVILINHGPFEMTVQPGDRIAQMVFAQLAPVHFEEVQELGTTDRGAGGFGSTGTK